MNKINKDLKPICDDKNYCKLATKRLKQAQIEAFKFGMFFFVCVWVRPATHTADQVSD